MSHRHVFATRERLALSLPDTAGRYELFSSFRCACGATHWATSWSRSAGRHLTQTELVAVERQERRAGGAR